MKEFIQKHKLFSFYTALMLVIVFIAIFAPWLAPGDAFTSDMSKALQAPSTQHWFGTDKLGRDVLSRIIYGTSIIFVHGCIHRSDYGEHWYSHRCRSRLLWWQG